MHFYDGQMHFYDDRCTFMMDRCTFMMDAHSLPFCLDTNSDCVRLKEQCHVHLG